MPHRTLAVPELNGSKLSSGGLDVLEQIQPKYRLEYENKAILAFRFQAASNEEALRLVADRLGIIHPMALAMFRHRGGKAVFLNGSPDPIYPASGVHSHH